MKSGLEGRNNVLRGIIEDHRNEGLNEVRPRRPEQSVAKKKTGSSEVLVSMKSGLEGRNNVEEGKAKPQIHMSQ